MKIYKIVKTDNTLSKTQMESKHLMSLFYDVVHSIHMR